LGVVIISLSLSALVWTGGRSRWEGAGDFVFQKIFNKFFEKFSNFMLKRKAQPQANANGI